MTAANGLALAWPRPPSDPSRRETPPPGPAMHRHSAPTRIPSLRRPSCFCWPGTAAGGALLASASCDHDPPSRRCGAAVTVDTPDSDAVPATPRTFPPRLAGWAGADRLAAVRLAPAQLTDWATCLGLAAVLRATALARYNRLLGLPASDPGRGMPASAG